MNKNSKRKMKQRRIDSIAQTGAPPQFIPFDKGHKAKVARKQSKRVAAPAAVAEE